MDTKKKILLVEDDEALANVYKSRLDIEGFETNWVGNGEDALSTALSYKPDLILLDLDMPLMNGSDMLERMRATEWGKDIKVLILTNSTPDVTSTPIHTQPLNADRYIIKAHRTPEQILDIVYETLTISSNKY